MNNIEFSYPIKLKISYFELPWNCSGSWKNWFIHSWEEIDKQNKSVWVGCRFFGITKVITVWTCSEKEAKKQDSIEIKRFVDFIIKCNKESVI